MNEVVSSKLIRCADESPHTTGDKTKSLAKPFSLNKSQKLAIDGLRGFLAIWVFWFHLDEEYLRHGGTLAGLFHNFLHQGWIAVPTFFALSGFLIFRSYTQLLSLHKKKSVLRFYIRRVFRIWPVWLVALGLQTLIIEDVTATKFLWNFFLLFGFHPYQFSALMIPISWSLFSEEIFYLSFPIIYKIVELGAIIPLLALSFLALGFSWSMSSVFIPPGFHWATPLDNFCHFFIGIAFALITPHLIKYPKDIANAFVTDLVVFIFLIALVNTKDFVPAQTLSVLLLFCVLQQKGMFCWIFEKLFSALGPRCYCIYLIHPFVTDRYFYLLQHTTFLHIADDKTLDVIIVFSVTTALTLSLAEIIHRAIELPLQNFGRRISAA